MSEALVVSLVALAASVFGMSKQFIDNKNLRRWICTRNPCKDRVGGEPPPEK